MYEPLGSTHEKSFKVQQVIPSQVEDLAVTNVSNHSGKKQQLIEESRICSSFTIEHGWLKLAMFDSWTVRPGKSGILHICVGYAGCAPMFIP